MQQKPTQKRRNFSLPVCSRIRRSTGSTIRRPATTWGRSVCCMGARCEDLTRLLQLLCYGDFRSTYKQDKLELEGCPEEAIRVLSLDSRPGYLARKASGLQQRFRRYMLPCIHMLSRDSQMATGSSSRCLLVSCWPKSGLLYCGS